MMSPVEVRVVRGWLKALQRIFAVRHCRKGGARDGIHNISRDAFFVSNSLFMEFHNEKQLIQIIHENQLDFDSNKKHS